MPTGPMWVIEPVQVSSTGRTRSRTSVSAPTIASSCPASASLGVRPKGASTICAPFSASSAARASVEVGSAVVVSTTTRPARAPARIPSAPRMTLSTWGEFERQMWMMSHRAAMSRGLDASDAPRAVRLSTGTRLRFPFTTSGYPACRMFFAMPWPIRPTPMKPTTGCLLISVLPCCDRHTRRAPPLRDGGRGDAPDPVRSERRFRPDGAPWLTFRSPTSLMREMVYHFRRHATRHVPGNIT